jgi:hypothetical protein
MRRETVIPSAAFFGVRGGTDLWSGEIIFFGSVCTIR